MTHIPLVVNVSRKFNYVFQLSLVETFMETLFPCNIYHISLRDAFYDQAAMYLRVIVFGPVTRHRAPPTGHKNWLAHSRCQ
jgi:hypothetical protein